MNIEHFNSFINFFYNINFMIKNLFLFKSKKKIRYFEEFLEISRDKDKNYRVTIFPEISNNPNEETINYMVSVYNEKGTKASFGIKTVMVKIMDERSEKLIKVAFKEMNDTAIEYKKIAEMNGFRVNLKLLED